MKQYLNEIQRLQKIAGLIKETEESPRKNSSYYYRR